MFGSSISQHVSNNRVSSCTNHDEGTAFLDVHFGGSLHALNTSFSDCSRQSNLVVDESHRNITQTGRLFNVSLECTSVKYSHCTYCHMTSADAGNHGGSAIFLRDVYVPLTLVCCFFDDCTATVKNNDGGAVHYQGVIGDLKPCLFTNCSFTECRVTQLEVSTSGGSIIAYHTQITTINHCFFDKSFAGGRAGAIYSSYCKFIVFNTAFIGCQTGYYGGAMFVFGLDPFLFHSVLFRDNKAGATFANAKDVAMSYFETLDLTDCFVNCNTNSKVGLYLCDGEGVPKENNTVLIPQNTSTFTISTPNIAFTADRATITVTASEALSGTMSFLLSGCLLPRLVHVEFGLPNHPSTTGQGIVTSGADGILPSPPSAAYSVRKWSWGGHVFPPFVLSATASPVDAETGQIDMTGIYLTSGTYSMVVRGSDDSEVTTVPVFESQSALTVTHGMSSTESNKLKYEMEYTIEEVRCDGELVRMESVYTFTIPYPASTLDGVDQTNDSDWTQLRFVGTNLVGARYTLWLETDDAVSPPHSTTVELSPSSLTSLSTWTAVLYPLTAPTLLYGRSYKVLSAVSVDGLHAPTITVGSFSTPSEPARIVSLVLSKYEDSMKTAVFSVTGRALTANMKYSKEIFVTATGAESGIGKAVLFSTDVSEIELSYSTTYTVEGVEDKDGVSVLYHSGLTFTTESEPMRLVTFRIERYLEKDKKVEFRMTGQKLETDETYDVSLSIGSSVKHFVSMKFSASDDAWMGSALLYPLSDAELSYGVEYNVTEFSQTVSSTTTTHFFESYLVKIIPEPPRLTTLNPIVAYSDQDKKGVVSLSGIGLCGEYTVTMTRSKGLSGTETMSVSFDSSGKGTINGVLYGTAGVGEIGLKYGTIYELSEMIDSSSKPVHFESDLVFETIAEPSRLTKVNEPTVGEHSNSTTIGFVGHHMVAGEYSVSLENTADETDTPTLVVTFASDGSGSGTAQLHPTAELKYGGTYKVIGMTTSMANARTLHVDGGLTFPVTPEPSRLTEISLTGKLDKEKKVSFSCCGRGMKNGPYKIKLSGSKTISASFDESGLAGSGTAVLFSTDVSEIELSYSTTYTVEGVEDKDGVSVLYHSGLTFTTGSEPMRLVTFRIERYLEKDKKVEFRMTGQKLETDETYDVSLSIGSSVKHFVSMKFSASDDAWMGSALLYPLSSAELWYGVEYNVTEFSQTVSSTTTTHFFESNFVKIMAEPRRLISIDSIVATGMNKSVLTLSSRTLTPNDQYELVFTGSPLTASNADHIFAVNVTVTSALSSTVDVTLYPSGANTVKYGHEYVLTSMIQKGESESILFENDGCKFRTPSEPARLKSIAASELKGDQKSLISLTITTAALLPNTPYSLTLLSTWTGQTPSHKRVLTMTTTEAGLLPVFDACLYPFVTLSGSQLSYNTTYNVDSLSWSEGKTLVDFGLSFSIPVEPARVEDVDFHLSGNRRRLEVTLIGRHLAEGMGKVCLKKDNQVWESLDVIELMNSTHAYAEFNVDETQSPSHIKYQNEYQVVPMGDASSGFFVNEDVVILVPAPPHITSIHCEFLNSLQNICKIQLKGTDFIVGTEYDVTLNNKVRIIVRFKTSSEGESEGVSIGKNGKLQYNTRYTLTDVKPLLNDDGEILHSGTLSFETGYQKVLEVIVREGGSSEISECGTIGKPCESVLVGWRVGEDEGVSGVVVKIDESVGFGGRVVVGEKEVEIGGLFEGENDLKVSSGDLSEDGVEGVVSVSGGRVVIVGVRLILPSGWEMREKRVRTVLSGFGECVVRSMSIVSGWKGEGVGMGLVSWLGGSLSVEKIVMEGVEMESGILLVNCSSLKKEVSLDLTSNRFIGVETRNVPLVDFSSKSKESCFSMRDCVFVSTERVESGVVGDRMGVIAVETWQEKMSIENCRFSDCGTVEGRSGSSKKGGVLIVVVGGSNVGERKELELLGNVFMDSCVSWSGSGEEKRGGVTVWSVGVGQTKIDLCGSWFEETSVSGAVLDRDSFGIPIVDGKRKIPSPNSPFSDDSPPSQRKPRLDAYHTTVPIVTRPSISPNSSSPQNQNSFLHAHTGTFSINPFFISPSNNNRRALTSLFSAPPLPLQSQSILPHHPTAPSHSSLPFQKVSANIAPNMVRVDTILIGQHRHTPTTCHADITAEVTPSSEVNIASRFNTPDTPTDCPSARHFPSEDIMHYHISESHCQ
ncbi:hypothetical protein BLNAU_9375 [Blattamonas nauphoetae]|uniref:Uncharacterized protein n=1 Tax=Blattamonas nauphoetae TaxID=2049346 RepID=A0ABQ9XW51_9EUKA|nr:hypothetical protein BLNAU_9375 [Blattamonas nauphoetae]